MSQTTLVELREYDLVQHGNRLVYQLSDATMHPTLELAHRYVQTRVSEEGMGEVIETTIGPIPGRAWATTEVIGVDTEIKAGRDLEEEQPASIAPDKPPLPPDE